MMAKCCRSGNAACSAIAVLVSIQRLEAAIAPLQRYRLGKRTSGLSNNQLVQCFLVSGEVLSFIYAGVAVLSEDYSGLILPAVVAIMFLLFPQARQWIETSSESSES